MRVSIAQLRAAGMTNDQIVRLLEEREAERREQNRKAQINHRSRQHERDLRSDIADSTIEKSLTDSSLKKIRKERKIGMPAHWQPTPQDRDYAKGKGWSEQRITSEGERFRNYYLANGKKMQCWSAKWQNWVTSNYQNGGNGAQPQLNLAQPSAAAERWEAAAKKQLAERAEIDRLRAKRT